MCMHTCTASIQVYFTVNYYRCSYIQRQKVESGEVAIFWQNEERYIIPLAVLDQLFGEMWMCTHSFACKIFIRT